MGDGTARTGAHRAHPPGTGRGQIHPRHGPRHVLRRPQPHRRRLMEIVSRPDIRGPEEAAAYVSKLRLIMLYLGTCDGNMQNGNLRADVNVSICQPGPMRNTRRPGFLPSRHPLRDQEHELAALHPAGHRLRGPPPDRHRRGGGEVVQETRLYDPDKGETRSMRSKEEAHDYRYFPDPDLLPLEIEQAWVDDIAGSLPELPDAKKARFMGDYGLSDYDASVLTADLEAAITSRMSSRPRRRQTRRQLGHQRALRPAEEGRAFHHRKPRLPRSSTSQDHHADQVRRHLRQDRQGPVRDRLHRRRRPRPDRRGARHETGHRHRRDRGRRG
jgi:hypothetical protein